MIIDSIKNLSRYAYIPNVQKAVDFLASIDVNTVENGKYDLGDGCKVNISEYETKETPDEVVLEAHREYLDIQLTVSGEENFVYQAIDLGEPHTPYNTVKDVEFFTAPWYNTVVLNGTNFALIFPNDLHAGSFTVQDTQKVKKFVFKLRIDG
ncbi:MAG: YhcH/YjgK/YiaL family protein [Clostridia bacterium]|nr:YhcH/YjgK/YiaL family protein [Clostridia bacterium]